MVRAREGGDVQRPAPRLPCLILRCTPCCLLQELQDSMAETAAQAEETAAAALADAKERVQVREGRMAVGTNDYP